MGTFFCCDVAPQTLTGGAFEMWKKQIFSLKPRFSGSGAFTPGVKDGAQPGVYVPSLSLATVLTGRVEGVDTPVS